MRDATFQKWLPKYQEAKQSYEKGELSLGEAQKKFKIANPVYYKIRREDERRQKGGAPEAAGAGTIPQIITYENTGDQPRRKYKKKSEGTGRWQPAELAEFLKTLGVV